VKRLLLVYEDRHWARLSPLADLTPVPALVFGGSHLLERWRRASGATLLAVEARHETMAAWRDAPPSEVPRPAREDDVLVVNAACLPGPWLARALAARSPEAGPALFTGEGRVAGAGLPFAVLAPGLGRGAAFEAFLLGLGLPAIAVEARFLAEPWQMVEWNPAAIEEDLAPLGGAQRGEVDSRAVVLEPGRVTVEAGARVDALAVLDARGGPIRLERGVVAMPQTVVVGPCAVGEGSTLEGGVIGRSSIGPGCRLAGEVDACLWQGYANKRHHGFVGHSVIGEWVNLGALTTTSDLKNNYGTVRVWCAGAEVDSGLIKVGAFLGAHVKTGIGTLLPTGASVGAGANLFGGGRFAPKRLPAFAWWDGERVEEHRFEAFLRTARTAMSRRARPLLPADEQALRAWFEGTRGERRSLSAAGAP